MRDHVASEEPTDPRIFVATNDVFAPTPVRFPRGTSTTVIAVPRMRRLPRNAWIAIVAGAIVGLSLGAYFALRGTHTAPKPARVVIAKASAPAPASQLTVEPILVTIRIDSSPSGAAVSLVEDGKPTAVGTTPIDVVLDPSHAYDVMVAANGYVARTVHIDPEAAQEIDVELSRAQQVIHSAAPAPAAHHVSGLLAPDE
jgi:hypothetical protein